MLVAPKLRRLSYADSTALLARGPRPTIVVCVPTVDEAATIGSICAALVGLRDRGAIDRVLVLDQSTEDTAAIAERAGAEVIRQDALVPEAGAVRGKGDAMWRALDAVEEDVTVFVDGDTIDFQPHMAADLAAAVALDGFSFTKATYRRPFALGDTTLPTGGGRVTELTAKPLLAALHPALRAFDQPLAGEIAARTDLLRALPFAMGYAVDVALLIDTWQAVGLDAMAQVETGIRRNRHRPLEQLAPMADEVAGAILHRAGVAAPGMTVPFDRAPMRDRADLQQAA
ncbi:MAG: glucosyl-3-phosphoglycerate synthase [Solirubrobacteraceae bacterium]|nr:glucosyl-3-phosphoglycerate synthase [Solirubrobacteraceae bacterium]